ncbi:MAG: cyclic pyranopterin monophosphate synthase MoaC [Proteobacteria bacterium]|nr:MAG: cyclic pyranopterin monophosphate synthase MoaC [Pseudomonadota bacterium]
MSKLSHLDDKGQARMVDVSEKDVTSRKAVAKGRVRLSAEALALIVEGKAPKGDVFAAARLAGIMAAKKTADLIPLCHPLPLSAVNVDFTVEKEAIEITATVTVSGRTGVEMEALTAVSVAALTLYDMVKAVDKRMVIGDIRLVAKEGGRSGRFTAE